MLKYVKRTADVHRALLGAEATVQDVYSTLEFNRPLRENNGRLEPDTLTHYFTIKELSGLSGVSRCRVYVALSDLVKRGLLEIVKTKKRGRYRYNLLMTAQVEVMKFQQNGSTDVEFEAKVANIPE